MTYSDERIELKPSDLKPGLVVYSDFEKSYTIDNVTSILVSLNNGSIWNPKALCKRFYSKPEPPKPSNDEPIVDIYSDEYKAEFIQAMNKASNGKFLPNLNALIDIGGATLDVNYPADTDLDTRFQAVDNGSGDTLSINGWLIESIDAY